MAYWTIPRTRNAFQVAIMCALPIEAENVQAIFDRCWDDEGQQYDKAVGDQNEYTTGLIGKHNVVLVHMPHMGNNSASQVAANLRSSYPRIQLVLVVGICGVAPVHPETQDEIVLGDIVISTAVTQYDYGRQYPKKFQPKREVNDSLGHASPAIRALINRLRTRPNRQRMTKNLARLLQSDEFTEKVSGFTYPGASQDWLYEASYVHQHRTSEQCATCNNNSRICSKGCNELGCEEGQRIVRSRHCHPKTKELAGLGDGLPVIHFGRFGSANTVMKSGGHRDELTEAGSLAAFEMEGAGVWEQHPTIVIKAACDYADSHKNKVWQAHAATMAAGCLKVFLKEWNAVDEPVDSDEPKLLGLCLASAPSIQPELFIGRAAEIDAIHNILRPKNAPSEQHRAVLGGMGGIGKTQLAIAYARQHQASYTSILWLNASSERTLHASFRLVAESLITANELEALDNKQVIAQVREWLSHLDNTRWLLIFDNYDDPIPNQFDVTSFYPHTSHGAIIITGRLPDEVEGRLVRVQPLKELHDNLDVLQTRSKREGVKHDTGAHALAKRLAGIPIALVTAGAYLCNNHVSFQEYLEAYEQRWQIGRRPLSPREYQDRTLYNTWNLTYSRLETEDGEAAQMLKLLAYFDNQELWYELLRAGLSGCPPTWLPASLANSIDFGDVMSALVKYGLVEIHHVTSSYCMYSIHNCVHDWISGALNRDIDPQLYWYAFDCVVACADAQVSDALQEIQYTRVSRHGVRLTHHRFELCYEASLSEHIENAVWVGSMLKQQQQLTAAERILVRALAKSEEVYGSDHRYTLKAMSALGHLYFSQSKLEESREMFERALAGGERAFGRDDTLTLTAVHGLATFYLHQRRFEEAEQMLERALAGKEKSAGPDHRNTLSIVHSLGRLYIGQGHLEKAEQMFERALAGKEKVYGPDHLMTINTVGSLGRLYTQQRKFKEAEKMFERALARREKVLGPDHASTRNQVRSLCALYCTQVRVQPDDLTTTAISLARLIQYVENWAGKIKGLFRPLALALRYTKAYEDAATAYFHSLEDPSAAASFVCVTCDACKQKITIETGRHICRQCHDIDLCNGCMVKYVQKDLTLPTCIDHEFYDLGGAVSRLIEESASGMNLDLNVWLAKLREKYPIPAG